MADIWKIENRMNDQERATVLAALRWFDHCQERGTPDSLFPGRINSYFDDHDPLTSSEIDALCGRISQ